MYCVLKWQNIFNPVLDGGREGVMAQKNVLFVWVTIRMYTNFQSSHVSWSAKHVVVVGVGGGGGIETSN